MNANTNVDDAEIAHFDRIAELWWDPDGKMGQLHAINHLRLTFITDRFPTSNPRVVDVGCGGGILSEALCRSGAEVTGIDPSSLSLKVARKHALSEGLEINYRSVDVETLAQAEAGSFDVVTCMEMLEHVPHPEHIVAACARLLKPGGVAFFSTINRSFKAFAFAIVAGEYILGLLPRGTHRYDRLIRPRELYGWAATNGLRHTAVASLMYNPLRHRFRVAPNREDVNYMASFKRET
ncbi:MAG: bifunctional 2-polyprenyl-6-hydroxyphenol methylase/3-demethylubiquinol 3-O-methyltransferase UbiG [Xanthomonadales bacterium]|nr:bifunctional 2-polyprenyl-6-hydroxyphenol methylase/3-demethylubiquinol 3-O-methyltransferase UbiG [Xanthomonadales bacterium]